MQDRFCINHPERAALEQCEVCGTPLCGYCLYYTDDGQRLCERHAQDAKNSGLKIIPPAVYAEGIIPSQASATHEANTGPSQLMPKGIYQRNRPIYMANNQDLNAFLAMIIGFISISACCGAIYCLPFLGLILAVLALMNAKDAVEPRRTRQQAWLGILTSGILVLIMLGCIGFYVFSYGAIISGALDTAYTPYVFPTNTSTPNIIRTATPNQTMTAVVQTATAKAELSEEGQ